MAAHDVAWKQLSRHRQGGATKKKKIIIEEMSLFKFSSQK